LERKGPWFRHNSKKQNSLLSWKGTFIFLPGFEFPFGPIHASVSSTSFFTVILYYTYLHLIYCSNSLQYFISVSFISEIEVKNKPEDRNGLSGRIVGSAHTNGYGNIE
jgi:hypothetical protein